MCTVGLSQDGSSSVPALIHSKPGIAATSLMIGEPHLLQKYRFTGSPLSPKSSKTVSNLRSIFSEPFGTATKGEKAEPFCFWQCLQWHTAAIAGSVALVYRTLPHKQPPLIVPILMSPVSQHPEHHYGGERGILITLNEYVFQFERC